MDYIKERTIICRACPICDQINEICNGKLYLEPLSGKTSIKPKPGYYRGCNCFLKQKIENSKSSCPAHKWNSV